MLVDHSMLPYEYGRPGMSILVRTGNRKVKIKLVTEWNQKLVFKRKKTINPLPLRG